MKALDIHENRFSPLPPPLAVDWGKSAAEISFCEKLCFFRAYFPLPFFALYIFFGTGFESFSRALAKHSLMLFRFSLFRCFWDFHFGSLCLFLLRKNLFALRVPELIRFQIFYCSSFAIIYTMAEQSLNLYCDCFRFVDDCRRLM